MTPSQKEKCHVIIHTASGSAAAFASASAQLPGADNIALVSIHVTMIISLGAVFGIDITESSAKSVLGSQMALFAGRGLSQVLVGWVPGIGNAVNAATAAGMTETVGWAIAKSFDK